MKSTWWQDWRASHAFSAAGVTRTGQPARSRLENDSPFIRSTIAGIVIVADNDRAALPRSRRFAGSKRCATERSRPVGDQRRPSFVRERCDASPAAGIPAGERFFRSPGTAREPVSVAMGGVSGARSSAADPRRRRAFAQHAARGLAGGSDRGRIGNWYCARRVWSARETDGPALLQHALKDAAGTPISEIRSTLRARASRDPLAIARVLAGKYPQTPLVSYIPSVAWANTLRLADITKDDALRQKVLSETRPWLSRASGLCLANALR